jgi:thiamine kinase-like enzyme
MEELDVVANFGIGNVKKITPLKTGHINNTFLVEGDNNYILQKINKNIFKTPSLVLENFAKISGHLENKLKDLPDFKRRFITSFKTQEGTDHYKDQKGDVWRLLNYQEDTTNLNEATNTKESFEAAKAFGLFQKLFLDFSEDLHITIEDFHCPEKRLKEYENALAEDGENRKDQALWERECVDKYKSLIDSFLKLKGELPLRIVHNDAKLSNVLFDTESGEGLCVIDLDTVMPGYTLFDFGDLVRSMAGPTEDERDLENIKLDPKNFKSLAKGYLHHTKDFLTPIEREHLLFGAKLIIYLLGIRFLTDFLSGDTYFKTEYAGHNLVRAQNQFNLLGSLINQEKELEEILKAI